MHVQFATAQTRNRPSMSTAHDHRVTSTVEFEDVVAGYVEGKPVLQGVSFSVPEGGATRLTGPNGIGKSTAVEVMSGFLPISSGTVSVLGEPPEESEARSRRRVCRTVPSLFPYMTVRDHLAVACRARGSDRQEAEARAEALGLAEWLDVNATTLSSGTAKKVWHVLSTVGDADLYILDEPFNAVDKDGVGQLIHEIKEWSQRGASVIVVCHTVPDGLGFDHEVRMR